MHLRTLDSHEFLGLAIEVLHAGHMLRFQASGNSMQPFILNRDILEAIPFTSKQTHIGDVLLIKTTSGIILAHRIVRVGKQGYFMQGDACTEPDGWFVGEQILGRVTALERAGRRIDLMSARQRWKAHIWRYCHPPKRFAHFLPKSLRHVFRKLIAGV